MKTKVDTHTHTTASGHAYSTLRENAEAARAAGLIGLVTSDHAPDMPGAASEWYFGNLKVIPKKLSGVWMLSGVELNILNMRGDIDLPEDKLRKIDVVIASVHSKVFEHNKGTDVTEAVLNAMDNPYVRIIGHPGDPRFPFDLEAVAAKAAAKGVALEINEQSVRGNSNREGSVDILRRMIPLCEKNGVYLTLGSDAHFFTQVGDLSHAEALLYELGFPDELVLSYDLNRFLDFLQRK